MTKSLAAAIVALCAASGSMAANHTDRAEVVALQQAQAAAWNAHDINAYSNLFTTDAHVINVLGWHWRSRAELAQKLGTAFGSVFAHSRMTIGDTSADFLGPNVAVAHVRWTMTGALSPTGSGTGAPQQGIQTQVLVKRGGVWRIADFQNTNSVPEQAFPPAR